jgi:hypothetical protein
MELQRQFAVGALELLLSRSTSYAQNLIVVAFSVASQNGLSPNPFRSFISDHTRLQCLGLRATRTIDGRSSRSFNL